MKIGRLRLRFVWGTGKIGSAAWRLRLAGYYEHLRGHPRSGLAFNVRGLLVLALVLAGLAYLGGATALYLWLDRRPHNFVTYTDALLLPLRMDEIRAKRGRGYIEAGIDDLKAQRWAQAEMKLRVGLRRYPSDTRARLYLAEFYLASQRRALALQLLQEGLERTAEYPGRRYLTTYFNQAMQGQEHERVVAAAERQLAAPGGLSEAEQDWLRQQLLTAMLAAGRVDEALARLDARPDDTRLHELRVLALLRAGRPAAAADFLAAWSERRGATPQIQRLQVRVYREAGRLEEMESALAALRRQTPADPSPYAYTIVQRAMAGDEAGAREGLDDYFLRFGANLRASQLLAAPLAEIAAGPLLEHLITLQAAQGHDIRPTLLQLAQVQIRGQDWTGAMVSVRRARALKPDEPLPSQELFELLLATLTDPAQGERLRLLELLARRPMPLAGYLSLMESLGEAGHHQTLLDVAGVAERHYGATAALAEHRTRAQAALEAARAPAATVTLPGTGGFMPEPEFLAKLEAAMTGGAWAEAAALQREALLARPAWLNVRHPDWLTRQMRIARENGDTPDLLLAVRQLLDGSLARSQLVVDYAQELRAEDDTATAVLLLREIQRRTPEHALSRRLLEAWTAKPEPAVTPDGS
ncbi:MAG: hypothetical protein KIT44_15635 [Opitutaceae bacterium]|nr:hypothetical protein [Opitutaceae bacterium]